MKQNLAIKRILTWILVVMMLAAITWMYLGFYKPDPYALNRYHPLSTGLLWLMRVLIPLIVAGIVLLIYRIRTKRTDLSSAGILCIVLLVMMLLIYLIINHVYTKSMSIKNRTAEYHPYLQLMPHPYHPAGKDTINIVCLGGSTTEFTDEQGKGWPIRLENIINSKGLPTPVRVHNQGRQWYTSLHSLINYETNIQANKPDVVLIMHTINDVLHNADFSYFSHQPFRNDYGHFYGPVNRIVFHQNLWGFLKEFLGYLWYHHPRTSVEATTFPGLAPFKQNLSLLIEMGQANGSQVILMTQPSLYRPDISDDAKKVLYMLNNEAIGPDKKWSYHTAYQAMEQYTDMVRSLADQYQVPCIDLDAVIPKTMDYFYDDVHYRTQTFDMIAQTIAEELLTRGITPDH